MNENCNESFSKALSDLNCDFLLEKISPIYIYENYLIGSNEIQQIDEQSQQNQYFLDKVQQINQIMIDNQFTNIQLNFVKIDQKIEQKVQQQQTVKKNTKQNKEVVKTKKDKIEYFDEEQLANYQKQQCLNLGLSYLQKTNNLIKKLLENEKIKIQFFKYLFHQLIKLSKIPETMNPLFNIFVNMFSSFNETSGHSYSLTEIILKINNDETQSEENIENILKFLIKLQTIKKTSFFEFYQYLCCYILQNKSYESKIKRQVVHCLLNLFNQDIENSQQYILQTFQIFVKNANTLSNFEYSEKLFIFLIKQVDKEYINLIFSDLLNLNDKAQQIFMKSLLLDEIKDFPHNFEIFVTLRIIIQQKNQLAEQVFQKINFSPETIEKESVLNFDLYRFVTNNIKENLDFFIQIIQQQFKQPLILGILIKKSIKIVQQLIKLDQPEEIMLFFPAFLNSINIESQYYEEIIQTMINECCSQNHPNLFQKSLQFCIDQIKMKGNNENQIYLQIFDSYLEKKISVQQQIFVLVSMGVLAPFIQNKEKVKQLGDKILNLLKIPDENIQKSISQCIPDLFIFFSNPLQLIQQNLISIQIEKNFEIQRGQAYLISGLIKGIGIMQVEDLNFSQLFQNIEKKDITYKLSIILILNTLIQNLNRLFEPYFLQFFDQLIQFFSESNDQLRNLAIQTARLGMSNISAYGVSKLLPILLKSLESGSSWRSKIANLWALGNMAYCSPKTLSSCLPQIVPVLSIALTDTHPKIRQAAHEALTLIGSTIRNPELTLIVDILIKSIADPFYENKKGLNILLKTEFVHFIDVPALSLIVPIIEYALTSRDQDSKELAGKIVATITYLIKDPKDLMPYLNMLIKALKEATTDHLTEVRTIASKAFGSLAKKLSFQYSDSLKECLFGILNSETSTSVERAGAAQSLCEVIYNIGQKQFDQLFPLILNNTQSKNKNIKEGYIGMFIFFPQIMEDQFEKFISVTIDHILITISDENESLRNLALRVIRIFIQKYGNTQIDLLLIPILEGVFSTNYLKRASCGILLEDILKSINLKKSEIYNQTIIYLYILRHDFVDSIKMQATNTWKANIENTPKTLKQLLPQLIQTLCNLKYQDEADINYILYDCIKEFMEKYQEQCLFNIYQIIEQFINENIEKQSAAYQILHQIVINSDKQNIQKLEVNLLNLLKLHMLSKSDVLRKSVFQVFTGIIQKTKNTNCLNLLVDPILQNQITENYEENLKMMSELLLSDSAIIIDHLTPKLFTSPLTTFKIDVIMNNSNSIGPYLYQNQIPLIFEQIFDPEYENKEHLLYCISQLSVNIKQDDVQNFFIEILDHLQLNHQNEILDILHYFLNNTSLDFLEYFLDIFQQIVPLICVRDQQTAKKINSILEIVLNLTDNNQQYLSLLISCMQEIQTDFFALNVENGLQPYVQIIKYSLVSGDDDQCLDAIELLEILINNCDEENFMQYSGRFLGYLIRVINYKKEQYFKQKIISLIGYFFELPGSQIYTQSILHSYFTLLGQKINQIYKILVENIINIVETIESKQIVINQFLKNFKKYQNEFYVYCLYELVKQKIQWFNQNNQNEIIQLSIQALSTENQLQYKSKIIIGKILGYLMKNNSKVILEIQNLENSIQGDETEIQNFIYDYLLVVVGLIRKSQDLGSLKKQNINILEYIKKIINVQRQMKIVLGLRKILNRPELSFLGVSQDTLKTVCDQGEDNEN